MVPKRKETYKVNSTVSLAFCPMALSDVIVRWNLSRARQRTATESPALGERTGPIIQDQKTSLSTPSIQSRPQQGQALGVGLL